MKYRYVNRSDGTVAISEDETFLGVFHPAERTVTCGRCLSAVGTAESSPKAARILAGHVCEK